MANFSDKWDNEEKRNDESYDRYYDLAELIKRFEGLDQSISILSDKILQIEQNNLILLDNIADLNNKISILESELIQLRQNLK